MERLYILVNMLILAGPLALSFDRKVAFYTKLPKLGGAIAVVGTAYIVWDVIATELGHWSFNATYAGLFRIAGLPIGEVLFFITVPYACIFLYEVAKAYFKGRARSASPSSRVIILLFSALFLLLAVAWRNQGYTFSALLSVSILLILSSLLDPEMWLDRYSWYYILLSFLPFLIANGVLTALPIVQYGDEAIWGVRVYTIPIEDFFYNFGMLGFYLLLYRRFSGLSNTGRGRRAR